MRCWMIRAGEGGRYFNEFIKHAVIAIGWEKIKDLKNIDTKTALTKIYKKAYPKESKIKSNINIGEIWAFCNEIEKGDIVLTPNPLTRTIFIGKVKSDYQYVSKPLGEMYVKHRRNVSWEKEVSRDVFSQDMRFSVGALLAVFNIDRYKTEIEDALLGKDTGIATKGRIKFPKKPKEEVAIGEPLDFEGLTNAPMEENGVIFLFGKLHERMGIRIKAIRKGFPDAQGEVWIRDKLYPRTLEFEFRSSDFKRHKHDASKCDIIICWEHDWRDCPRNIFVIELKRELESYIKNYQ